MSKSGLCIAALRKWRGALLPLEKDIHSATHARRFLSDDKRSNLGTPPTVETSSSGVSAEKKLIDKDFTNTASEKNLAHDHAGNAAAKISQSDPLLKAIPDETDAESVKNLKHLKDHEPSFSRSSHVVVESIGSAVNATKQQAVNYSVEINKAYAEVEHNMMARISESNQQRFRLYVLSTILLIIWLVSAFGGEIRKMLSKQTAGLAQETLKNESLKIQTQELAMAVVQTVLNDKEVTAHAASFLREASVVPETQQALLELTLHVLQHPDTLDEVAVLVKKLIVILGNDPATMTQVVKIFTDAMEDPKLKVAIVKLLGVIFTDPEVINMVTELTIKVIEEKKVIEATNTLLMSTAESVLSNNKIIAQSKDFVTDVMGDDALQKEGGDALWNSVTHALKPGAIRIIGFSLIVVSIAVGKVLLSPF